MTGIAMRPNQYGLTFHTGLDMHWGTNGGGVSAWYGIWNNEYMNMFSVNQNYINLLIPICPIKDPSTNRMPDFYLIGISHQIDYPGNLNARIYLYNNSNSTSKYLGHLTRHTRGRFGIGYTDESKRSGLGIVIPSPEPEYIQYVGERPYVCIRIDKTDLGNVGNAHFRFFCTEVINPDGSINTYDLPTTIPVTYT
jgi:hypothetical protein